MRKTLMSVLLVCSMALPLHYAAGNPDTLHSFVNPPPHFLRFCQENRWVCEAPTEPAAGWAEPARALLARVNRSVNRAVEQTADIKNYGRDEHWTLPRNGRGDCEDFALEKMYRLIAAGVDPRRLMLAVTHKGENHLVLVVRTEDGDVVLDSLRQNILSWSKWQARSGYVFLAAQSARNRQKWEVVHRLPESERFLAALQSE